MVRWGSGRAAVSDQGSPFGTGSSSHTHTHDPATLASVVTPRPAILATLGLLLAVAAATIFGLVALWPNGDAVATMVDRGTAITGGFTTARGEVLSVREECADPATAGGGAAAATEAGTPTREIACQSLRIGLLTGPDTGRLIEVDVVGALATAGITAGDTVELVATVAPTLASDSPAAGAGGQGPAESPTGPLSDTHTRYAVSGVERTLPLALFGLLFAIVVIAVGRLRGALALAALAVSALVLGYFVLPGLVAGGPGLLIGLVGSVAIMFVTLFFVHGPNMRTAAALIGTLFGIAFVSGFSLLAVATTRLSGVGDEASGMLAGLASEIDLRGLLTCSILIAGLGVLNDITIAQASSVWELRSAAPHLSRRELYARAMRIGRDHIASTVYTVVFAYVGAALSVLLVLFLIDAPVLSLLTREDFAIEIVRTLTGSVGLVLAVPVTTAVAAWFVPSRSVPRPPDGRNPLEGVADSREA